MELSLAELKPLKARLSKMIQEKIDERRRIAFIEFDKDDEVKVEEPEKSFDQVTQKLLELREDYRKADLLMAKANVENYVKWEDGDITIKEALELAVQLRGEAHILKQFGESPKITKTRSYYDESTRYRKALFEPNKVYKKGEKLLRKADRLSMAIEKTNHNVTVVFPEAEKYI